MPSTCKNKIEIVFNQKEDAQKFVDSIKLPSFIEPNSFEYNIELVPFFKKYDKQNNLDPDFKYDENFFLTRTTELELKNLELNENILTAQFESISNIFSEQSILKLSQVLNASITIKFYEENFFYGITKANQVECFTVSEETKLNDINENMYKQLETELLSKFEKKKEH